MATKLNITTKQLKNAIKWAKLKQQQTQTQEIQKQQQENHDESKDSGTGSGTGAGSGTGGTATATNTSVSSVDPPFIVDNPLIVILGIGSYGLQIGLNNLPGVAKDYSNIIDVFVRKWNYFVLYKTESDDIVYSNNINNLNDDNNCKFKLRWSLKDIDLFIEQARMYVVKNKHNGLIFIITSHGDNDGIIYDSNMTAYELSDIFNVFLPEYGELLTLYTESKSESNHLFRIPKIYCVDSCRSSWKARVTNVGNVSVLNKNNQQNITHKQKNLETKSNAIIENVNINMSSPIAETDFKHNNKMDKHGKAEYVQEIITTKSVTKQEGKQLVSQHSNICKLWANVDGFSVGDGSQNGGLFLRSVVKVFKDKKFVTSHNWMDIVIKIREYTKEQATIVGAINFTQIVQYEGTMERSIQFKMTLNN